MRSPAVIIRCSASCGTCASQTQPVPFARMEEEPGQEVQVDFGQGAWVMVNGKRKRPHLFLLVLSHSRKACQPLRSNLPDDPFGGTHASIALHKLGRTREAKGMTLSLAARFNGDYSIAYNLACYCAQLGEIEEAQRWFETALSLDADTVRRVALDNPDLDPIWKATKAPPASPSTTGD